ncbi:MAG: hypothetical protein LBK53_02110 [Heliobacteriaceae bacterium]|jgi:glycosidase|nr:hypothetical protein [Heliobacteriaceae bacterium]
MINAVNPIKQQMDIIRSNPVRKAPAAPSDTNILSKFLENQALINAVVVKPAEEPYKNDLKTLFTENRAKILAIIPRTFNAQDKNGNEYIDGNEQHGTLLNAVERLDEVKKDGFNTVHVLPVHPPGRQKAMGTAGSLYSPANFTEIDPKLIDRRDYRSPDEQFKAFIDECHKRGIKVMLDLPSCASYDMFLERPELMAIERDGLAKTPQGWNDIKMFQPWLNENEKILNPALLKLHKDYIDWCINLGVDGIRADVARAKPVEFWDIIIPYSHAKDPEFCWLAETYTYEDASSQANMPYDRPEDSWNAGFDSIYGQYHIFHEWGKASEFIKYVKEQLSISASEENKENNKGKSFIGSFATHDDISPMFHGGTDYCNLTMGLQVTLPMLNPYVVDGYQTGDYYLYPYGNEYNPVTVTDNNRMTVHKGKLDIFNLSRKPGGKNPEIGSFMRNAFKFKDAYSEIINKGSFIELEKESDKNDQIIAYARHFKGRTLLVVANRNVNRPVACIIKVPTLKASQDLDNLLPSYGKESILQAADGELRVDLGAGRVHVFEISTPNIEQYAKEVLTPNL